jgi:hypothetical protein
MASATPTGSRVATAIGAGLGHAGRLDRAGDSQPQGKVVLPQLPGTAPPLGTSLGRGRPGGLRQWGVDPQGRPAGGGPRPGRRVQGSGVSAVRWPAGHRLARAPLGEHLTRTCGWTPSREGAPAAEWSTGSCWSPTPSTPPATGRSSAWTWARPRPRGVLAGVPALAGAPAAFVACSWWPPTLTKASSRRSPRCSALHGNDARCISCATRSGTAPRSCSSWSARRSARSSGPTRSRRPGGCWVRP